MLQLRLEHVCDHQCRTRNRLSSSVTGVLYRSSTPNLFVCWCPTPNRSRIAPGVQHNEYPFLKSFLKISNRGAADVVRGDVQSTCADPKRWLNPAGHSLLSELPGFGQYNASMLWGTYRPGVYFGERMHTACQRACRVPLPNNSVPLRSHADTGIAGKNVVEICSVFVMDEIGIARHLWCVPTLLLVLPYAPSPVNNECLFYSDRMEVRENTF